MNRVPAPRNHTKDDGAGRAGWARSDADHANCVPDFFTHSSALGKAAPRLLHFPLSPTSAAATPPA